MNSQQINWPEPEFGPQTPIASQSEATSAVLSPLSQQINWPEPTFGSQQQETEITNPAGIAPNSNPTRQSELARTPQFLRGTLSDVPKEVFDQAAAGWQAMTQPTESWGEFAKSIPSRAMGALALTPPALATAAGLPIVGHPMAAALHATGSLINPETAALDVPDTTVESHDQPIGMIGEGSMLGNPLKDIVDPLHHQPIDVGSGPRGLYSKFTRPAANFSQMLATPRGYTASPYHIASEVPLTTPKVLASEDYFNEGSAGYNKLRQLGVEFDPNITKSWTDDIQNVLRQDMGTTVKLNAPKVWGAIDSLRDPLDTGVAAKTIDEIRSVKRAINFASANPTEKAEHYAAFLAQNRLNELLSMLDPAHMTSKVPVNPKEIMDILHEANGNWAVGSRLETYENARRIAENQAAASGSGANVTNKLRQAAEKIVDQSKRARGIPAVEKQQLSKVVHGTTSGNLARMVGKIAPTGAVSIWPTVLSSLLSHYAPAAVATLGYTAKALGEASTANEWAKLGSMAANSGPLAQKIGLIPEAARWTTTLPAASAVARRIAEDYSNRNP